ncbi:UPF0149 family protein [Salinibius halmophilus]|uniref:UPF0149 family protein n=1 Tax=Salinibius halmophilus TaxID=1853216 RepID=UPI000E6737D4|nr:UPF0149 family protein [Salinibius halmophilus]
MSDLSSLANVTSVEDVAALSISSQDVPALLAVVERANSEILDGAWLALAHLADEALVPELIKRLKAFAESPTAQKRLPTVVDAIGEPAIVPFGQYMVDKRRKEPARRLALIALASQLPKYPDPVIEQLESYRGKYDDKATELNKLYEQLMGELEKALAAQKVDGHASQDEQMALVNKVENILEHYGSSTGLKGIAQLDGFCTAMELAARPIDPQFWLAHIWADKRWEPQFKDQAEVVEVYRSIVSIHNAVVEALRGGNFEANVEYDSDGEPALANWIFGFRRGQKLWTMLDTAAFAELDAALDAGNDLDRLNQALRDWWSFVGPQRLQANQPFTRSQQKVGRNDPCPCGSGKKLKKCCKVA